MVVLRYGVFIPKYDSIVVSGYDILSPGSHNIVGPCYDIWELVKSSPSVLLLCFTYDGMLVKTMPNPFSGA